MERIVIYRHPACPRCARIARRHKKLDWFGRIRVSTDEPVGHAPVRKGEIVVQDLSTGTFLEGADAVRKIFRQVPLYLPLLALLRVPALARRADDDARGGGRCTVSHHGEVPLVKSADVTDGILTSAALGDRRVVISRVEGVPCALDSRCPHMGLSLERGTVQDGVIRCPWHGSRFDMRDGLRVGAVSAFAGMRIPGVLARVLQKLGHDGDAAKVSLTEHDGMVFARTRDRQ